MATKLAQEYLEALAEELQISETRYDQAYDRYKSLGNHLNREASSIKRYAPNIYAQGSFALGTVIKPCTDTEEYDVDAVCEMKLLSKSQVTQEQLKSLLGKEIEAYRIANSMKKPLEEKRRCWELGYADGAQFHMDIVPALPNAEGVRILLEQRSLDTQWGRYCYRYYRQRGGQLHRNNRGLATFKSEGVSGMVQVAYDNPARAEKSHIGRGNAR
jgi:hypothetical protein